MDRFAHMIGPLKYFDFRALLFDIAMQDFGGLAPENMDFFCCGAREALKAGKKAPLKIFNGSTF